MTMSFAVAAFLAAIVGTTPLPLVDRLAGSLRDGTPALEDAGPKVGLHVEKCFCADFDAPGLWFSLDSLDCGAVALRSGEAPVVASVPVSLAVRDGGCADAAVATVRPCPMPVADWKAPAVLARGTRCIAADAADAALASMVYAGLCDGTLSPRLPKWRPILLDMLAGRVRAGDFDHVFELLLATFPGSDSTAKIAAALEWVAGLPLAKDSADVCRALTRRYISTGEYDLAIPARRCPCSRTWCATILPPNTLDRRLGCLNRLNRIVGVRRCATPFLYALSIFLCGESGFFSPSDAHANFNRMHTRKRIRWKRELQSDGSRCFNPMRRRVSIRCAFAFQSVALLRFNPLKLS